MTACLPHYTSSHLCESCVLRIHLRRRYTSSWGKLPPFALALQCMWYASYPPSTCRAALYKSSAYHRPPPARSSSTLWASLLATRLHATSLFFHVKLASIGSDNFGSKWPCNTLHTCFSPRRGQCRVLVNEEASFASLHLTKSAP